MAPLSSCLFIYSIVYISVDSGIYFTFQVAIHYSFIYFVAHIVAALTIGSFFFCLLCPF